jgi:uncharacterized membrane protein (UPF0127 family)
MWREQLRNIKFLIFLGVIWFSESKLLALEPLTIETKGGSFVMNVEQAITPESIEKGLMFRQELPLNQGMLFVFQSPRQPSFWMKNTLIPLDMIFIDSDGKIVDMYPEAEPHSLKYIVPRSAEVKAVLEVPGGTIKRLSIVVGDQIHHQVFSKKS